MRYYFIATNYNNSHHTINYINNVNNLRAPDNSAKHIIIVDNHSSESLNNIKQIINKVRKESCDAVLILNTKNLGYFKGLNCGLEAIDFKGEYTAIIGNNDIIFDDDFMINLNSIKLKKQDYCIAPNVYLTNGKKQNPHILYKPGKISIKLLELYYRNYHLGRLMVKVNKWFKKQNKQTEITQPTYIYAGIGAVYVLTPHFFKKNKLLNAPVFLYGEEIIFSHQIHSTNGKILYHPEIKVFHNEHATVSKLGNKKRHKIGKESFKIFKKYY